MPKYRKKSILRIADNMDLENVPSDHGRPLIEVYSQQLTERNIFAPVKKKIGPLESLTDKTIKNHFEKNNQTVFNPRLFLLEILTLHDQWGRPLQAGTREEFSSRLNAIDPQNREKVRRDWTILWPRTAKQISSDAVQGKITRDGPIATKVTTALANFPTFANSANLLLYRMLDPTGQRFSDPDEFYKPFQQEAKIREQKERLGEYKPPQDKELWLDYIFESRDAGLLDDMPPFTDSELRSVADMFLETQDEFKLNSEPYALKTLYPDLVPDEIMNMPYMQSFDFQDRYRFCLKLARVFSNKDLPQPASVENLLNILRPHEERLEEFIDWVSYAGDIPIPSWLRTSIPSTNRIQNSQSAERETPAYIKESIRAQTGRELYYLYKWQDIPDEGSISPNTIASLLEDKKIIRLPLDDLASLNDILHRLFPSLTDNYGIGAHVMSEIPVLARRHWISLLRLPMVHEKNIFPHHVRKLTAAKKRSGLYGALKKINGREIVIFSQARKKDIRD